MITKTADRKYLVALRGHNHALGEIECFVTLPDTLNTELYGAHVRVAVARAAELNEELNKALVSTLHRIAGSRHADLDT
jgi:hypothetical protein